MRDCVELAFGSPWFDTVDQEHIPIRISNSCGSELEVELEAITPAGEKLQKFSLNIPPNSAREVEVVTELYLKKIIVKGKWREASGGEWFEIRGAEVTLR